MDYLTTDQAGKILGVTVRRVRALIEAGRLPASKFGKVWMINKKDLKKVAIRKPGRPKGGHYGKG
jgi:excisionase family DNA binding protein